MAQAAVSLNYETPISAGVVIEDTPTGVRVTVAPLALWLELGTLVIKAIGLFFLLAPVGLALVIGGMAQPVAGVIIGVIAVGFWLLTAYRFARDCWEFQRFTIVEADPSGLTWRRVRGRSEQSCHLPRRFVRDINLLTRRSTWWGQHSVFATVRLWGPKPEDVPQEALTIWLSRGDFGTAFEVIEKLLGALKISASDAAHL
jgi:hypothetical protein